MDLVEPHQNRNQIREKIFPFIIELTVPLPECTVGQYEGLLVWIFVERQEM